MKPAYNIGDLVVCSNERYSIFGLTGVIMSFRTVGSVSELVKYSVDFGGHDGVWTLVEENLEPASATTRPTHLCATEIQEGGTHYMDMDIQPIEYITRNNLGYCEGNVVKYVSRYKAKNGVEDLRKARHYIDMLMEANRV